MIKILTHLFPLIALLLAACATPQTRMPKADKNEIDAEAHKQKQLVVENWLQEQGRLQTVVSKILTSGASLCGEKVGPYFGMHTWTNTILLLSGNPLRNPDMAWGMSTRSLL